MPRYTNFYFDYLLNCWMTGPNTYDSGDKILKRPISYYDLVELDGKTEPNFSVPTYHRVVVRYNGMFYLRSRGTNYLVTDPMRATVFTGPNDAKSKLKDTGVI